MVVSGLLPLHKVTQSLFLEYILNLLEMQVQAHHSKSNKFLHVSYFQTKQNRLPPTHPPLQENLKIKQDHHVAVSSVYIMLHTNIIYVS